METNGNATLCLSSDWLDYKQHPTTSDSVLTVTAPIGDNTFGVPWVDYSSNYLSYWPSYNWYSTPKITLKLSEVMYLREKAAEDKKLRKVLKKFAPHIEITVDFPGGA